jgi:hypothetical protein
MASCVPCELVFVAPIIVASAVGHCDICATANAVSDAVPGLASRLPLGTTKNDSNSWIMR